MPILDPKVVNQVLLSNDKCILDELAIYDRAVTAAEINKVKDGELATAVDPQSKLAVKWGDVKEGSY